MTDGSLILFGAIGVLCSANAQFILRHDRRPRFRLASIQGAVGRDLRRRVGIDPGGPDIIIVVEEGRALRVGDALLAILRGLGWPWRTAGLLTEKSRRSMNPPRSNSLSSLINPAKP